MRKWQAAKRDIPGFYVSVHKKSHGFRRGIQLGVIDQNTFGFAGCAGGIKDYGMIFILGLYLRRPNLSLSDKFLKTYPPLLL